MIKYPYHAVMDHWQAGDQIIVACKAQRYEDFREVMPSHVDVEAVGTTASPGDTIRQIAAHIDGDQTIVVNCDQATHFQFHADRNFVSVYANFTATSAAWCSVGAYGEILSIDETADAGMYASSGVYGFDTTKLKKYLRQKYSGEWCMSHVIQEMLNDGHTFKAGHTYMKFDLGTVHGIQLYERMFR